ncbi:hypothetical protein AC249_AIPGENE26938 [Exaiptasia diaphana]|nr:hypothetical protein AC249_AIPGENE26938 [Exaiptasia diaphana]
MVVACTIAADVIIIMDMSGSVNDEGVKTEKNFANQFLGRFNLQKSRVGIVTYDNNITSILTWEQSANMSMAQLNTVCLQR